MSYLEFDCPNCHQRVQLPAEVAGKRARCPACAHVWDVPAAQIAEALTPAEQPWWLETPEGRRYGPIGRTRLDAWVSEGRVTHDCQISPDQGQSWQSAGEYYPVLALELRATDRARHPFARLASSTSSPETDQPTSPRYLEPHRGGLILTLGLMSWIACPVLAFFAWTLGSGDLQEMREGRMDPSGEGLTRAGYWLGMIQVAMMLFALVAGVVILIIGYAAGAWAGTV